MSSNHNGDLDLDDLEEVEEVEVEVETEPEPDIEPDAEPDIAIDLTDVVDDEPEAVEAAQQLEPDGPMLADVDAYRQRWNDIQTGFVDEPLDAVESAGHLLAEVLGELASTFATKRSQLEAQWRHGGETSTEDLRLAFQAYRSFFDRVVAT